MFGVIQFPSFVLAYLLLLFLPGPGNLAVLMSTGRGGKKAGLIAAIGIVLGNQFMMALVYVGIEWVIESNPAFLKWIQIAGAAYLVLKGVRMLVKREPASNPVNKPSDPNFWPTLVMTLFNGEAVIFYSAFFPQFIDPLQNQGWVTLGFMSLTTFVLGCLYFVPMVLVADVVIERVELGPDAKLWIDKLVALCFLAFGLKMALFVVS